MAPGALAVSSEGRFVLVGLEKHADFVPSRERGEETLVSAKNAARQTAKREKDSRKPSADLSLLAVTPEKTEGKCRLSNSHIPWAELLKRSFDFRRS